ncbi:hypothetical protein I4U23_022186 [Adineta vaga]|nr:hypothetical protein I4U23_022186 [Adineta vaga]
MGSLRLPVTLLRNCQAAGQGFGYVCEGIIESVGNRDPHPQAVSPSQCTSYTTINDATRLTTAAGRTQLATGPLEGMGDDFVNDHPYNTDCLDRTDENNFDGLKIDRKFGFNFCYHDPTFRCEESDHFFGLRGFVCGDGQNIKMERDAMNFDAYLYLYCKNRRNEIMWKSTLLNIEHSSNLTSECFQVIKYIMLDKYGVLCPENICGIQHNFDSIFSESVCNESIYILFPMLPFLEEYAEFGFWKSTINNLYSFDNIPLPDFMCYNEKRCPFFEKDFTINNKSCSYLEQYDLLFIDHLIELFHTCLLIDKTGNETDCFYSSLFHCSNTSKCISKHRVLDGISDCINSIDEDDVDSCKFNDKYRFYCSSKNKCLSPVLIQNLQTDCVNSDDETFDTNKRFSFQNLCNGYTQLSSTIIDGKKETDETNCEHWPCNNQYTQCNGAWECSNGLDEVNCDLTSPCYPNHHLCVSPIDLEIKCLPINQAGDGKIDCLGSTDERAFCRRYNSQRPQSRYRCWNESRCTLVGCRGFNDCQYEWDHFDVDICWNDPQIQKILTSLALDEYLGRSRLGKSVYFILSNMSRFESNISYKNFTYNNVNTFNDHNDSSSNKDYRNITYYQAWICNRGILIYKGREKIQRCLCPPSYYGNRCQFQSQRVSLTLQFSKECAPNCRGIYSIIVTLIDNDNIIHSYDQFIYISTSNCDRKYNIYLLFHNRSKNLEKNYTIRIDAYNKIDLLHFTSWILPIKFLFLPVNRISAHLILRSHPITTTDTCTLMCNNHGRCVTYFNREEDFCLCDSGWSGINCSIRLNICDCSSDSKCLGEVDNRSICLCSQMNFGSRCFLSSICRTNPCKNKGQCIAENEQISRNTFICICEIGYSGLTCEIKDTRIDISFHDVNIPSFLLIHFITVQTTNHPLITTISKKIRFDEYSTTLYISIPFNLIFIQIHNDYYLAFLQRNNSFFLQEISLEMKLFQYCPIIDNLLDKQTFEYHILRRAKFYHNICRDNSHLSCFYDPEAFMCLCNNDNFTNCFSFDFTKTSICKRRTTCENGGQCLQNRANCPQLTMCICNDCYYGGKCQFTTKGFGLSLNVILGYHIHSHLSIVQQSFPVKITIIIIIIITRTRSTKQKKLTYIEHLRKQVYEHKHHIISPFILVILTLPRLIISFFSGYTAEVYISQAENELSGMSCKPVGYPAPDPTRTWMSDKIRRFGSGQDCIFGPEPVASDINKSLIFQSATITNINTEESNKEDIKTKLDKGIFKTYAKPNTSTATWWKTFLRIQDDKENIIPYVQCVKCFSIFAYDSIKTGSSTHKAHAEICRGDGDTSAGKSKDIVSMLNKENPIPTSPKRLFTEAS